MIPTMSTTATTNGTVEGTIERVTYHNAENGFSVIQVKVRGRRDLVTVVGCLAAAIAEEFVETTGRWVIDKRHGQQFQADSMRATPPGSPEGMEPVSKRTLCPTIQESTRVDSTSAAMSLKGGHSETS